MHSNKHKHKFPHARVHVLIHTIETSVRECPPGLAGSWGRPGRGRQNVVTPARSRVAKEMMGSLFEPKIIIQTTISDSNNWIPSPLYRKHWSQICVKYVYIYYSIYSLILQSKNNFEFPILTNVLAGPGT